jgi:hypothetical protein
MAERPKRGKLLTSWQAKEKERERDKGERDQGQIYPSKTHDLFITRPHLLNFPLHPNDTLSY